ncbi:Sensor-like histidine kinase SenX3 OS=Streptomyces microflavus OX=1919 GN=Smic_44110 PE=4 SV=1 [Streptomyces microflavus]
MQIEATRLTNLVQELIDLSRVQNDDPLEDAEPVKVEVLVAEAIDRCRQQAGSKQITMASGGTEGLTVWVNTFAFWTSMLPTEVAALSRPDLERLGVVARRAGGQGDDRERDGSGGESAVSKAAAHGGGNS